MSCNICRVPDYDCCDDDGVEVTCRRCRRVISDRRDHNKSNRELLGEGKVGLVGYLFALVRGES
jgi:hypothetical protein